MRHRQAQLFRELALSLLMAAGMTHKSQAQLAVTEVMSATKENTNTLFRGPEYWELTNFGTNDVSLHGYGFRDSEQRPLLTKDLFANLVIHAGESLVFFRVADADQSVINPAQFRTWWGDSKLPAELRFRTWRSPGLSGWEGDAVWLFDGSSNVVDLVEFGRARLGRAFTYDRETGFFGIFSAVGVDGAFGADLADDVGSPGTTTGPVPVHVLQPPLEQMADAGSTVSFAVIAGGLPRPRYQWSANGEPIWNGTSATLVLSNVQPSDAGAYHVWITNGLSGASSATAVLMVNTNPTAPTVVSPPADATVFSGQTAVFNVTARGLPAPSYQWQLNGADIAGAIHPRLEIVSVSETMSGGRYSARIWNTLGATNLSAMLIVDRRPDLRFTEVMALPANEEDNRHFDWFELTNFDTNTVNLRGWRFSDHSAFARAFTITNDLILQPGECAVFAERLDARLFAAWWGADSLPEDLQLITYNNFGLGASGDTLYLWNGAATDPYDYLATVSWASNTAGVTLECRRIYCDAEGHCVDEAAADSALGWRGAFQAVNGGDIGSPGYVTDPPLRILSITREQEGKVHLRCRVSPGKLYRLRRSSALSSVTWTPLEVHTATNNFMTLSDQTSDTGPTWFYRVEEMP